MSEKGKFLAGLAIALTSLGDPKIAIIAYNALQGAEKEAMRDE